MKQQRFKQLLESFEMDTASLSDIREMRALINSDDSGVLLSAFHETLVVRSAGGESLDEEQWSRIADAILSADKTVAEHETVARAPLYALAGFLTRKWWAAASILVFIAGVVTIAVLNRTDSASSVVLARNEDIPPGKNGAVLTLADGSQVVLDTVRNGLVALQGGVKASLVDGELVYLGEGATILYNTMSTPNGRQFSLSLPDGTRVWLNAASSITFPTTFIGNERKVEITGEVYFEVAKNESMPFRIDVNKRAQVTVLGTHFNINAYDNESSINTTLLEGKVSVAVTANPDALKVLSPGEQAQVLPGENGAIKIIDKADLAQVVAWKNGLFHFEGMTMREVMRQMERWYDITVLYEQGVPNIELSGKMTKGVTLKGLINVLEELGVRTRLDGKKLTVLSAKG